MPRPQPETPLGSQARSGPGTQPEAAPVPRHRPARRLTLALRDSTLVAAINTGVALVLTLMALASVPELPSVSMRWQLMGANLVFSQCIGLLIYAPIEALRLTLWWQRPPRALHTLAAAALAVPFGYLLGGMLAGWLVGAGSEPLRQWSPAMLSIGLVSMGTTAFAVHFITHREQLAAERSRAEAADLLARSAQLQLLQQQIEPHMLFNTLATAHALIDEDPPRAQQLLEALSELLRSSMQNNAQATVSLRQEFALLRNYLQLMSLRMGKRLTHSTLLPPELEALQLPPLLVQPLVENAIKHGLDPQVGGGSIQISARREAQRLLIEVVDDGLGLQVADPFAASRIGLSNIRHRLACAYDARASLSLEPNTPRGVVARLSLPL